MTYLYTSSWDWGERGVLFNDLLTDIVLGGGGTVLLSGGQSVLLLSVQYLFVQVHQQLFGEDVFPSTIIIIVVTIIIILNNMFRRRVNLVAKANLYSRTLVLLR